jgi:integrase
MKDSADRNRAILLLLLDTGMRASELCGLNFSQVDSHNRRVRVMGKGAKERAIPFSPRTGQALWRYLTSRQDVRANDSLIATVDGRGDPYTLQELLGHSSLDMVKNYLRIAQIDIDSAHCRASPVDHWRL